MESTLKGKNLLLEEQILSFKSWPLLRREVNLKKGELLSLKVYKFILKNHQSSEISREFFFELLLYGTEKTTLTS